MRGQKSAEAVVAASHSREGPNTRSHPLQCVRWREADADTRAEMPSRTSEGTPRNGGRYELRASNAPGTRRRQRTRGSDAHRASGAAREPCSRARARGAQRRGTGRRWDDRRRLDALLSPALAADPRASCSAARTSRNRCGGWRSPSRTAGMRMLGIPTVLDRLIQQALLQVLSPLFDPTFSDASFGFRPGRSAHQAVQRAPRATSRRVIAGWWTWTWRNSSTA